VRDDGIYGKVTWTERAIASITGLEYRFISPVFWHEKSTGRITQLLRAGLTNTPNFPQLPALASQEVKMKTLLEALVALFSLPTTADQEAVLAHVQQIVGERAAQQASVKGIASVLGIAETATLAEIKNAVVARNAALAKSVGLADDAKPGDVDKAIATAAATAKAASGDTARLIGDLNAQVVALQAQVTSMQGNQAKSAAEQLAEDAIKAGKIVPSLRDWAIGYASSDQQGFKQYLDKMPVVVKPGTDTPAGDPPTGKDGLSASELAICSQLGITPEQFKANRKEKA
jgi:phage I-like protein